MILKIPYDDITILRTFAKTSSSLIHAVKVKNINEIICLKEIPFDTMKNPESVARERECMETLSKKYGDDLFMCKIIGTTKSKDSVGILMDLVQGAPLHSIYKYISIPESAVRHIIRNIVESTEKIHQGGFSYRDMKASNVILNVKTGMIRLVDFGLSKHIPLNEKFTDYCGTPHVLAPEVLDLMMGEGNGFSKNADWWAVGVLAYELFCGSPPFGFQCTANFIRSTKESVIDNLECSKSFKDFLRRIMDLDDQTRLSSASQILSMGWFNEVSTQEDLNDLMDALDFLQKENHGLYTDDLDSFENEVDVTPQEKDPFEDF